MELFEFVIRLDSARLYESLEAVKNYITSNPGIINGMNNPEIELVFKVKK